MKAPARGVSWMLVASWLVELCSSTPAASQTLKQRTLPGFRVELVHYRDLDGDGRISCTDRLRFRAYLGYVPSPEAIEDAAVEIQALEGQSRLLPSSAFAVLPGPDEGPVVVEKAASWPAAERLLVRLGRVCPVGACRFQNYTPGTAIDFEVSLTGIQRRGADGTAEPPTVRVQVRSSSHATATTRVSVAARPCVGDRVEAPPGRSTPTSPELSGSSVPLAGRGHSSRGPRPLFPS